MLDFFHYTFGFWLRVSGIKIQALTSGRQGSGIRRQDLEGDLTIASDFKRAVRIASEHRPPEA